MHEVLEITAVMNSGYHEPEKLQEIFAKSEDDQINEGDQLLPGRRAVPL